jgi:FkbM family methyltransferase
MQSRYRCKIIGVEANPTLAAKLGQTGDRACFNIAIAPARGDIDFYIDPGNSEASGLARGPAGGAQAVRVPGMPLSDFMAEQGIDEIDLLKIDIEGAEIELLASTPPDVLARIRQICIEFHIFLFPDHAAKVAAVLDRLRSLGFLAIDFSRNWEDALLVNERLSHLSEIDKLSLRAQKYAAGVGRILRRTVGLAAQ